MSGWVHVDHAPFLLPTSLCLELNTKYQITTAITMIIANNGITIQLDFKISNNCCPFDPGRLYYSYPKNHALI
jgi:hypothetical protein